MGGSGGFKLPLEAWVWVESFRAHPFRKGREKGWGTRIWRLELERLGQPPERI